MIEEIAYFLLFIIVKNNKFYEYKIILVCLYVLVYGYVYVTLFKCYLQKINSNFFYGKLILNLIYTYKSFIIYGNNTSYYIAWTKINLAIKFNKLFVAAKWHNVKIYFRP